MKLKRRYKALTQQVDDEVPDFIKNGDQQKSRRSSWAKLLKRVFQIDVEKCGICGEKVKIIAAIKKKEIIEQILDHIGLPSVPPEITSSRGPPEKEYNHYTDYEVSNESFNIPVYDFRPVAYRYCAELAWICENTSSSELINSNNLKWFK